MHEEGKKKELNDSNSEKKDASNKNIESEFEKRIKKGFFNKKILDHSVNPILVIDDEEIVFSNIRNFGIIDLKFWKDDPKSQQIINLLESRIKKKQYHYPREKIPFIIKLMKKFELCYEINDDKILIPDLLPIEEPEFDYDYSTSLKFVLEYDFIPKSIMPRLIVKLHDDIVGNRVWRTGLMVQEEDERAQAVIKADEEEKKIFIFVSGKKPLGYLFNIRKVLRLINDSFEGIDVHEKLACPCKECQESRFPHFFKFDHLVRLSEKKDASVYCENSLSEFSVRELLEGISFDPLEEIEACIEKGHLREALKMLEKLAPQIDNKNELILFKQRITVFEQESRSDHIEEDKINKHRLKLSQDLLAFVSSVFDPENDY